MQALPQLCAWCPSQAGDIWSHLAVTSIPKGSERERERRQSRAILDSQNTGLQPGEQIGLSSGMNVHIYKLGHHRQPVCQTFFNSQLLRSVGFPGLLCVRTCWPPVALAKLSIAHNIILPQHLLYTIYIYIIHNIYILFIISFFITDYCLILTTNLLR